MTIQTGELRWFPRARNPLRRLFRAFSTTSNHSADLTLTLTHHAADLFSNMSFEHRPPRHQGKFPGLFDKCVAPARCVDFRISFPPIRSPVSASENAFPVSRSSSRASLCNSRRWSVVSACPRYAIPLPAPDRAAIAGESPSRSVPRARSATKRQEFVKT